MSRAAAATRSAGALAACALALLAPGASAAPGDGFRVGAAGRLRPFVELRGGWDSIAMFGADGRRLADVVLHGRAGADLSLRGDLAVLDLAAAVDRAEYLEREGRTGALSRTYADALVALALNRGGRLGLELDDDFARAPAMASLTFGSAALASTNDLALRAPWRPGGGALAVAATAGWRVARYEPYLDGALCDPARFAPCDSRVLGALDHDEVRAGADVRWQFLPRTAAVVEGAWLSRLPRGRGARDVAGAEVRAGVEGLVRRRLAATAKVGWAEASPSSGSGGRTWLADLELEWFPSGRTSVHAGWGRGLGIDPGPFSIHASDRLRAGARRAAGRITAGLDAGWERFASKVLDGATASLTTVEPSVEVALLRWMAASAGYRFSSRSSSFGPAVPRLPGFGYDRHEGWLKLRFVR